MSVTPGAVRMIQIAAMMSRLAHRFHLTALVRTAWVLLFVWMVVLNVAGIPAALAQYHHLCSAAPCPDSQLTRTGLRHLHGLGLSLDFYADVILAVTLVFPGLWMALGLLLFLRSDADRMALIAAYFLLMTQGGTGAGPLAALADSPSWQPFVGWVAPMSPIAAFVFSAVFPSGSFTPRWTALFVLPPVLFILPPTPHNTVLSALAVILLLASALGIVVTQVWRYRTVLTDQQRRQTWGILLGGAVSLLTIIAVALVIALLAHDRPYDYPLVSMGTHAAWSVGLAAVPISISVAVLRYRLWEIDTLLNRALVYGSLTAGVILLYTLVVGYLGLVFRTGGNLGISLLATGLVAVLFQPARARLQRAVNRLMYGEQDDPYAVLARLGRGLESTLATHEVLPRVVETVTQALKLPYAAIALEPAGDAPAVAHVGMPPTEVVRFPLSYRGEVVGALLVGPRPGERSLSPIDRRLLADLARQAGAAAYSIRLTAELQRSRERLVTTREEERRRVRRDLHDGLGPALASVMLKINTARRLLDPRSPAESVLVEARQDVQASIADIRRLVYDLRPPALDELGLLGAIREGAAEFEGEGRRMRIEVPDFLPPLPAAVEVAAYRIVQEALTNVVRHAGARTCTVRLCLEDGLRVEVTDDGVGLPPERHIGVGLTSMRERAAELGGACVVDAAPGGGTRIRAHLPLPAETG